MKRLLPVGLFALVFTLFLASTPEAQVRIKRGFNTVTTLLLGDGTAAAPSLSFANDPDTGAYRPSANIIAFSAGGTDTFRIDNAAGNTLTARAAVQISDGYIFLGNSGRLRFNNDRGNFTSPDAGVATFSDAGYADGIKFQFEAVPSITTNGITGEGFGGGASVLTGSTDTFGFIRVGAATEGVIAFATDWGTNLQQGCTANNEDGTPTYVQVTDKTMRLAGGTRAVPVAWTSASVVNWICGGAK